MVAWGADRRLDNPITLNGTFNFASTLDDTQHTLTLGGDITLSASGALLMGNSIGTAGNQRNGSGDVIINGNVLLNGTGTQGFTAGQGGSAPTAGVVVGKMVFNGNILNASNQYTLTVSNGSATVPTVVQLNGQNTYLATSLGAAAATLDTAPANIGIGSSSVLDGGGNIVSGPLGLGIVTVSGANATGSSIEALGGPRTVANTVNISTLQSTLAVRGTNDLTLSGPVTGGGGLTTWIGP